LFHPRSRDLKPHDGKLTVHHSDFDSARAMFPHDERTALRAFAQSEARRIANKLVLPAKPEPAFDSLVASLVNVGNVRLTAVRSRRWDLAQMLMRSGRFERKLAGRLFRRGKLSAATARAVLS
jgi:hypothetical protein